MGAQLMCVMMCHTKLELPRNVRYDVSYEA